jgi:putative transposase
MGFARIPGSDFQEFGMANDISPQTPAPQTAALQSAASSAVCTPQELQLSLESLVRILPKEFVHQLQPCANQAVYNTWLTIWLIVYQMMNGNKTLNETVASFLDHLLPLANPESQRIHDRTLSLNSSGLSRSRTRLQLSVAQKAVDHAFEKLCAAHPTTRVDNRPLYLLDGSSISLASHAKLRRKWPPCPTKTGKGVWPICSLALAFELESGMAIRPETGVMYGDKAESELDVAMRLLPRIPANSLIIADRLYDKFGFWHRAVSQGYELITRLSKAQCGALLKKTVRSIAKGVSYCQWVPSARTHKTYPDLPDDAKLTVYVYEFVGHSGQPMMVASTLKMTLEKVAELYDRRADIETDIRHWKGLLEMSNLRSKSVEMVEKEVALSSLSFNLIVQIRRQAALQGKIPPRRISMTSAFQLVTMFLFHKLVTTPEDLVTRMNRTIRGLLQRKLPNRKKRRSYPRQAYSQRAKYPAKPHPIE